MEEENTIIELIDENGAPVKFDLVMTFDYEGKRYAALLPIDEVADVGEDEVVLLLAAVEVDIANSFEKLLRRS